MILEGLNSTEWWFLRERIKNVEIDTLEHRVDGNCYYIIIEDNDGQQYELGIYIEESLETILKPDIVRKL